MTAPRNRHRGVALVALGAVLLFKVALALTLAPHPLLQPVGDLDAGEYWRLAQRVVRGDVLLQGTPFYVSPLYIYWLAVAQALTGGRVAGVLLLQAILGTAAVWITARTAALWVPLERRARAGLVAGGALALCGVVALQEALILQSALDALLMSALAFTVTCALQRPRRRAWCWCGLALGLLATNRPNASLLAALIAPAAAGAGEQSWRGRIGAVAALALGVSVVLVPLTLRTARATGEWQVLPGHGGLNFYIGNHPEANGSYTVVTGIRPSIEGQREDARRLVQGGSGARLTDAEVSRAFVQRALAWWRHSPVAAARHLGYKLWLTTHPWELPVNVSYAWFREHVALLMLLPVGAWLLVPAGVAVTVGGHLLVDDAAQRPWRWFRWMLPVYLVSVALFFVVDRYRAPALVLAAIDLGLLAAASRSALSRGPRRVGVGAASLAAIVAAAGVVPLPFQLGQAEASTGMALQAIEERRDAEATAWLTRAASEAAAPGVAWFRAGLAWQARGEPGRAEQALRKAYRHDPEVQEVAFALAGVLLAQGKGAEAVPLLQQVEQVGAHPERVRLDLALAYWQAGDRAEAQRTLLRGIPRDGLPLLRARGLAAIEAGRPDVAEWLLVEHRRYVEDDAEVAEKLGLLKARAGDMRAAETLLQEATRLGPDRATARFNLAIVRVRQGRRDEALALLREALRLDPGYVQAAGALQELLAR